MRRRTFLITTAALPPLLGACSVSASVSGGPAPTPSLAAITTPSRMPPPAPPSASATPSSFSWQPLWPDAGKPARITALRNHHLCGSVRRDPGKQATTLIPEGDCPIIADVEGPTTWALLPDGAGWTIKTLEAQDDSSATAGPPSAPTITTSALEAGPALLDANDAYLTVGVIANGSRKTGESSRYNTLCPVDLIKVGLNDGTISASTRLSDAFDADSIKEMSLSFTEDRSALRITGSATTHAPDKDSTNIGDTGVLQLSAADLSVQPDAAEPADPIDDKSAPTGVKNRFLYTEQNEIIVLGDEKGSRFSVRRPGEAEPVLSWRKEARDIPDAACVFGDVVYALFDQDSASDYDVNGMIRLVSLSSGEEIGEVPGVNHKGDAAVAVSAWGLALNDVFYPATEWLDS